MPKCDIFASATVACCRRRMLRQPKGVGGQGHGLNRKTPEYKCQQWMNDSFLLKKLDERQQQNAFRRLLLPNGKTDFCSNDYLGIVHNQLIEKKLGENTHTYKHGSTGSRLLAGNYALVEETEKMLAAFH
jgi:7-keto-8-aminopelargonate synthetase-like enzyme